MAVKAVKDGAYDFLLKPVETERLIQTVSEALELDQTRREESAEDDRVRRSWDLLSAREKRWPGVWPTASSTSRLPTI